MNRYTNAWDEEYIKYGDWLASPRCIDIFQGEKLLVRQTGDSLIATYDDTGIITNRTVHCVRQIDQKYDVSLKYLLGLLNSKLTHWVFRHDNFHMVGKPLAQVKVTYVERLPIVIADDQQPIIDLVDKLLAANQSRHDKAKVFIDYIKAIYSPAKINERLQDFYKHDFSIFTAELKKQKVKITTKQEMELMSLFNEKKTELGALSQAIKKLDDDLDEIVFGLYKITDDERKIICG